MCLLQHPYLSLNIQAFEADAVVSSAAHCVSCLMWLVQPLVMTMPMHMFLLSSILGQA